MRLGPRNLHHQCLLDGVSIQALAHHVTILTAVREYKKITVEYPLAAAEAFTSLHDPFKFVYVSGMLPPCHVSTPQF